MKTLQSQSNLRFELISNYTELKIQQQLKKIAK